ncbi:hypothetical protein [Brachybacterium subflavum]|uniref:hypothetical protein n=1 Tax=Brachybacterium subflavum TaxID=2585206 RepID=UPI0012668623|nr:hypothetical protein [Brachybacterium subflavum]
MGKPSVQLNSREIDKLLKSPEVQKDLRRRTNAAARAAGDGYEADVTVGSTRALGMVRAATPKARASNAKHHTLMQVIDQMRG